jgi:hypothetical protein
VNLTTETYLQRAYDLIKLAIENDKFENELSEWDKQLLREAMYRVARVM